MLPTMRARSRRLHLRSARLLVVVRRLSRFRVLLSHLLLRRARDRSLRSKLFDGEIMWRWGLMRIVATMSSKCAAGLWTIAFGSWDLIAIS